MKRPPPRHASTALPRGEVAAWWVLVGACGALAVGSVVGIAHASAPKVVASVDAPEPRPHVTGVRGLPTYAPAPVMSIGAAGAWDQDLVERATTPVRSRVPSRQTAVSSTGAPTPSVPPANAEVPARATPAPTPGQNTPYVEDPPTPVGNVGAGETPPTVTPEPIIPIDPEASPTPSPTDVLPEVTDAEEKP